jgi:hypothetical protein
MAYVTTYFSEEQKMKRELLIITIVALCMGIAQGQGGRPVPMQSGGEVPKAQGQQPQGPAGSANQVGGPVTTGNPSPQAFIGCLRHSAGSWTLASDKGQSIALKGADQRLTPFSGQEVRIEGTQASDGSIQVANVTKLSDSCSDKTSGEVRRP